MSEKFAWTFPGGKKTVLKGTAVLGNAAITKTIPTGKRAVFLNAKITLTTDGTVVNRYPTIRFRDAVAAVKVEVSGNAIAASTTANRFFNPQVPNTTETKAVGQQVLDAAEDIYLFVSGGVAGDAWDYLVEYLEIDVE